MVAKATPPDPGRGNGRKRSPGAGRPKTQLTKTRDEIDLIIAGKVAKDLDRIYAALIDLALGHELQERTKDGGTVVYTTSPDFKAASYLIDRAAGKPRQPLDVKNDNDNRNVDPHPEDVEAAEIALAAMNASAESRKANS